MQFDRPIAFLPNLARELGGMEEAIFYQQLYYWSDKGNLPDGWIYKTLADIEQETTLTRRQQDRVRRKLVEGSWIEVKKTHAPNGAPTLHYRCLVEISISTKRTNGNVPKVQMDKNKTYKSKRTKRTNAPYTESTPEKTTESTPALAAPEQGKRGGEIAALIKMFEPINPSVYLLYKRRPQQDALKRMVEKYGLTKVENTIKAAVACYGKPYAPSITTPTQLEEKLGKLIQFWKQDESKGPMLVSV